MWYHELQAIRDAKDIANIILNDITPIKSFEYKENGFMKDGEVNKEFLEKFKLKQAPIMNKNFDKSLETSPELYNASVNELSKALRFTRTRGMMVLFKEEDGKLHDSELYGNGWLEKNGYGYSNPWELDLERGGILYVKDFLWKWKKIYEFAENRDELVVTANAYPIISLPESKVMDKMCEMVLGFKQESPKMREFIWKDMIYRHMHSRKVHRYSISTFLAKRHNIKREDVPFPKKLYKEVFQEHEPSVKILCKREEYKKIPVYVNKTG